MVLEYDVVSGQVERFEPSTSHGNKSGNQAAKSSRPEKSGTVGQPTNPDLFQND
jgi:hypothetical protein